MTNKLKFSLLAILALFALTLAPPAGAVERPCPGPRDAACLEECKAKAEDCREDALAQAKLCLEGCKEEAQAARLACRAHPDSDDCHTALAALKECLQTCREELQNDRAACNADGRACVTTCPLIQ